MVKPNPALILVDVSGSVGMPGRERSHPPTPNYNNGVGKITDYGWLKEAVIVRRLMMEAKIRGATVHLYEFGTRGREVEMRPGFVDTHESILKGYDYVPIGRESGTIPERALELAKTKVKGPVDLFVVTDGYFAPDRLEKAIGSYASKVTIVQVTEDENFKHPPQTIPKEYGWDVQQYAAETKKQSRPKVKGVVNPKGITQVFGTPIDFKALPEKISINRRLSNGKFKLEAHYPAKHFNDKQNYIGKRKEGSYCRFYDNKSPFFIARTVWDAASQPGMHMMVKNRGETHRFIVTPKVDDPTKASVIGSYLVHRDNGDPVLCSGVIGELEAVGDDGDFKVIPYKNHGIRCPKFDSDKNELAGHIPQTFEYKKSTKPRGPRKTAADYCKPTHTFTHPTDIKKAEMVAAMDDELGDEISCLECAWNGTYEDLIFIDADGTGGGGYDFVLACPICDSDEWLDDMMEAEGYDEPCFSCDGMGAEGDEDCSYCAGSGLMSDTLRAEMALYDSEYFDADCGCFKKKSDAEAEIKIYSFKELSEEAQTKAVADYIEGWEETHEMGDMEYLDALSVLKYDYPMDGLDHYKKDGTFVTPKEAYGAEHQTLSFMDWAKQEQASHMKKYGAETNNIPYHLANTMDESQQEDTDELKARASHPYIADYIQSMAEWGFNHQDHMMLWDSMVLVIESDERGEFDDHKAMWDEESKNAEGKKNCGCGKDPCITYGAEEGMEGLGYPVDWKDDGEDNNEGFIYGIHWMDGEEVIDVNWYKTEAERDAELKKAKEQFIRFLNNENGAEGSGEITTKVVKDYHWETEPHPHEHDDLIYNGYVNEEMKGVMEDALEDGDNDSWVSHTHYTTDEDGKDVEVEVSGIFLAEDKVPRWAKPLGLIGGLAIGYISAQMIDNKKE